MSDKYADMSREQLIEALTRAEDVTSNPRLTGIHIGDGAMTVGLEGIGPRILAETFAEDFKRAGAVNFLEISMTSQDPDIGEFVVTMQRKQGKTAGQMKHEAEAALEAAQPAIRFAGEILKLHRNDGWPGDIDGATAEAKALECGLLEPRVAHEPCCDNCACSAACGEWPVDCIFLTEAGEAAVAASNVTNKDTPQ